MVQLEHLSNIFLIYKIICDKHSIPGMTHYGLAYAHHLSGSFTNIYIFLQTHLKNDISTVTKEFCIKLFSFCQGCTSCRSLVCCFIKNIAINTTQYIRAHPSTVKVTALTLLFSTRCE